jgi:hypothetical protein
MTIRAEQTAENLHTARLRLPQRDFAGLCWWEGDFAPDSPTKRYAVREDYSRNPSVRTPLVKLGEFEYTPS